MQMFWNSRLEMAGLTSETTLQSLKNDKNELYSLFYSIKKKFFALRLVILLIVSREAVICVLEFSYIIELSKNLTFKILNYIDRSFY